MCQRFSPLYVPTMMTAAVGAAIGERQREEREAKEAREAIEREVAERIPARVGVNDSARTLTAVKKKRPDFHGAWVTVRDGLSVSGGRRTTAADRRRDHEPPPSRLSGYCHFCCQPRVLITS